MDDRYAGFDDAVSLQAMLGYLNFSEGKPDPRFQKQLNDAYTFLVERGSTEPWRDLGAQLRGKLDALRKTDAAPFRDATQVEAVLALTFVKLLPAYRAHHADLLFHLSDRELFQPFMLARMCEAVLLQGGPWNEDERIVRGAITFLNDFVGHRPIAILETRPRGEPYDHEKVRPIPLYLRGAGVAVGRYRELIEHALGILKETDTALLADAGFEFDLLDELALDPRAYDHGHPVNRRPNYVFGEWDPHHLDNQGRHRRFVVRQVTLDALLHRVEHPGNLYATEVLFEAAAVLAGTILMASGVSGSSPTAHESTTSLSTLVPRIARNRDSFYTNLLQKRGGSHGARLFQEMTSTRQAFGAARQHLNHYLARQRAAQLQQRHLALIFAEMGYPEASRRQAAQIPTASIRVLSEIQCRLSTGMLLIDEAQFVPASRLLGEIEELLHRGIANGSLADPWNILGFQGLFPLFTAQEDSIRDQRIDDLIDIMAGQFRLYSWLMSESAGHGEQALLDQLKPGLRRLAAWWDRFASAEVGDVRHVLGSEASASAEHVADALTLWHQRGEAADLAFWKKHLQRFRSPKSFALVIDALLRKPDYPTVMALLVTWVGQAEQVPLDDGDYSFNDLALRWLLGVSEGGANHWGLIKRFFDHLEANAEDYWEVPELERTEAEKPSKGKREEDELYEAAYEDVTYKDSTDDDVEGSVSEGGPYQGEFDLENDAERLGKRLRFLATMSRLWQIAVQKHKGHLGDEQRADAQAWLAVAAANEKKLSALLDDIHACVVPEPLGTYESIVEYDRRRTIKEQLLYHAIGTCLDYFLSVGTLRTVSLPEKDWPKEPAWGNLAGRLEQSLVKGDPDEARTVLPQFLQIFRNEPLLFSALADGGEPRQILRVRIAQTILRALGASLPRMGLLRETYHLLKVGRAMEQVQPPQGRRVTQFNELFQTAYQAIVEAIVDSAPHWGPAARWSVVAAAQPVPVPIDRPLADLLEKLTTPFLKLWVEHSRTMQIATLEAVQNERDWEQLKAFVQRYGKDLFTAKFMTLGNLRGILHRGVAAYLDYLRDNPDPMQPIALLDELGRDIPRDRAVAHLTLILQAIVESYEEYKDYKNNIAQSDYGENLYTLLDFLRLKARYARHAWHVRPLVLTHEVLVHKHQFGAARLWREAFENYNRESAQQILNELANLEQTHGIRLPTVSDRLNERFVKPLDIDRLAALIKPAMDEATEPDRPSFALLEKELQPYIESPTGVGLDVPHWLQRLEHEVDRVWTQRSSLAVLAEHVFHLPSRPVALDDLQRQLADWEKPII